MRIQTLQELGLEHKAITKKWLKCQLFRTEKSNENLSSARLDCIQ